MLSGNDGLDLGTGRIRASDVRELSRHRTENVVAAVRDHESRTGALSAGRRPHDLELYARVQQLLERGAAR